MAGYKDVCSGTTHAPLPSPIIYINRIRSFEMRSMKWVRGIYERLTVSIEHWPIITWKVENYGFGSNFGKLIYTMFIYVSQVFRGQRPVVSMVTRSPF